MDSGIYQLVFPNGSHYVGKSINVPRRWEEHKKKFLSGTAAKNMQQCYDRYGFPEFRKIFTCHGDHIDLMESYFICKCQPDLNANPGVVIYQHELPIFEDNEDLLQLATSTHMQMIKDLKLDLDSLQDKHTELREYLDEAMLETMAGKELEDARMAYQDLDIESNIVINKLREELEEADSRAARWEYIARKPWWKKLLGIE